MYIRTYVYIYIYMYSHTYTCTHIYEMIYVDEYNMYMHMCESICICVYRQIYMYTHIL